MKKSNLPLRSNAIFLFFLFSACTSHPKEKLIGKWKIVSRKINCSDKEVEKSNRIYLNAVVTNVEYEFNDEGRVIISADDNQTIGTFKIKSDTLVISYKGVEETTKYFLDVFSKDKIFFKHRVEMNECIVTFELEKQK